MENQFREDGFIPKHGGYENLITFQKADIIFHGTKWGLLNNSKSDIFHSRVCEFHFY